MSDFLDCPRNLEAIAAAKVAQWIEEEISSDAFVDYGCGANIACGTISVELIRDFAEQAVVEAFLCH
ncbi:MULTISPECIES: hypothetical protein [unclassified Sphingobium]|uniref:hypothetical protein n=1 Tax=unclassified Sphingobium TaxID=2611147 RepID=UPI0035A67BCE